MKKLQTVCLSVLLGSISLNADVINGNFRWFEGKNPSQAAIEQYRKNEIKCPDAKDFASNWTLVGKGGSVEFPKEDGNRFARISGGIAMIGHPRYYPKAEKYALSVDMRGEGVIYISFLCYAKEGNRVKSIPRDQGIKPIAQEIRGKSWTRYLFIMDKPAEVASVHLAFQALKGTIDIDNAAVYTKPEDDDMFAIANGEAAVRNGKLFLSGDSDEYAVDDAIRKRTEIFRKQELALKDFAAKNPQNKLAEKLLKHTGEVAPYLLTEGVKSIGKNHLNRAAALCKAIEELTGSRADVSPAAPSEKKTPAAVSETVKTGNGISISNLKPEKLLCRENEDTFVTFSLSNETGKNRSAVLEAILHSGISDKRTVHRENLTLRPGTASRKIRFNAGPESFGRAIEVKLTDADGTPLASGREYFQANREFMRVMLHGTSKYQNVQHRAAHEATSFGVQINDDRIYYSDSHKLINRKRAENDIRRLKEKDHMKLSFYQSRSICNIVGMEEVRKHPDYILYSKNGQPMSDPIYGGIPNPIELAAPSEMEPARRKELLKGMDFLDVKLNGWYAYLVDFSNFECLAYGAKCIGEYGKARNLDIVYLDDIPCLHPGYRMDGKNITAGMTREQMAKLNSDIARIWNSELRRWRPEAGSWCNGAHPEAVRWYRSLGMWERTVGFGVDIDKGQDVSDDFIRELAGVYNSICLSEVQHVFTETSTIPQRYYEYWRNQLLSQRDYTIQKYKGSVVFGYAEIRTKPDISREPPDLYWPTISYFQSLTIATQHHHILYAYPPGLPCMQPYEQFATRYSGLLWDRELIAMPPAEVEKNIKIESGAKLDYKDFVYTRKYGDSDAVIIHLVRPYPLKKWDLKWKIQASMLKDVKAEIAIPAGKKPVLVKTMRPYLFREKPEIVEQELEYRTENGKLTVTLPEFSYYSMIAVKFI